MKKFLHNRRNDQQGKKTTYGIGEISANDMTDKGLISNKTAHSTQHENTNMIKNADDLNSHFFQNIQMSK